MTTASQTYGALYYSDGTKAGWQQYCSHTRSDTIRRKKPKNLMANPTELLYYSQVRTGAVQEFSYGPWLDGTFIDANSYQEFPKQSVRDRLINDAILKTRLVIKDEHVNLAVVCGEYRNTCALFADTANKIYEGFSRKIPPDVRKMARHSRLLSTRKQKLLASLFLSVQYGWKPLLFDIDGSARALAQALYGPEGLTKSFRVKVGHKSLNLSHLPDRTGFWDNSLTWSGTNKIAVEEEYSTILKGTYRLGASNSQLATSLGFTNPASVAWELIPYSFVIDWMFPVGDWLSSLDALVGISDLSYQTIEKGTSTATVGYNSKSTSVIRYYERSPQKTNLPIPNLRYKPSQSLEAVLNGLALLRQIR